MEKIDISAASVVEYFLISWIPWLLGIVVGGGLGVFCALGIHAIFSARPVLRRPLMLLPWRTLVMGLLMALWSPFLLSLLGIGPVSGGVMVAGSVFLLSMIFTATTLVENWHPSALGVRFIGGARTMAMASGLIAAGVGLFGGGGLGYTILEAARLSLYGLMWKGLLVMLALALVLDLTLGVVQMIAFRFSEEDAGVASMETLA